MVIIFGERMYGKVDRVTGVCYVITIFAHLNFIPLVPTRSYIVIEGTEDGGGQFRGKEVSVSLKSVLAGYIRVWCGAVMLIAGVVTGFATMGLVSSGDLHVAGAVLAAIAGVGAVMCLFVGGKFGAVVQVIVHILSVILWYMLQDVGQKPQGGGTEGTIMALLFANFGLLMYGLTRIFDHAGPARARELLMELGVEVPEEGEHADEDELQKEEWEEWDASEDRKRR